MVGCLFKKTNLRSRHCMILLLYTFMQTSSQYSIYQKNCNLSVDFVNKTDENDVYEEHGSEDDLDF